MYNQKNTSKKSMIRTSVFRMNIVNDSYKYYLASFNTFDIHI